MTEEVKSKLIMSRQAKKGKEEQSSIKKAKTQSTRGAKREVNQKHKL